MTQKSNNVRKSLLTLNKFIHELIKAIGLSESYKINTEQLLVILFRYVMEMIKVGLIIQIGWIELTLPPSLRGAGPGGIIIMICTVWVELPSHVYW